MAVKEARSRHLNVLKASNKPNASFLVAKAENLCWTTFWTKCLSFWAMRTKRSARSQCYLLLAQCKLSFRTNELKNLNFSERDPEIVKKVADPLYNLLQHHSKQSIYIQKRAIVTCSRIYPQTLLWTNQRRNDREAEKYWKMFEILKVRILGMIQSPNEG